MMVLGLGDIVFLSFWLGWWWKQVRKSRGGYILLFLLSFSFSSQEKQTRIGVLFFFYLLRVLSINLPAKGNISNGNDE